VTRTQRKHTIKVKIYIANNLQAFCVKVVIDGGRRCPGDVPRGEECPDSVSWVLCDGRVTTDRQLLWLSQLLRLMKMTVNVALGPPLSRPSGGTHVARLFSCHSVARRPLKPEHRSEQSHLTFNRSTY